MRQYPIHNCRSGALGITLGGTTISDAAPNVALQTSGIAQDNLYSLYQSLGKTFWAAEKSLWKRQKPFVTIYETYKFPLPPDDPLYQKYFSQLLQEYSTYKRDIYIGDNYDPDPQYSQPAKPGVTKLLFYCQFAKSH